MTPPDAGAGQARSSPVRMALILASSACLGGIAVALWNRSSLTRMREAEPGKPTEKVPEREFV